MTVLKNIGEKGMDKLNILVLDDCEKNRRSAQALLGNHNLTVVGNYDDAQLLLQATINHEVASSFGLVPPKQKEDWPFWEQGIIKLNQASRAMMVYPKYDVVMTDLMMKPSHQAMHSKKHLPILTEEQPVGVFIALLALSNGVKNVGVLTDTDHHEHPASAAFDCFPKIRPNGISVVCTNRPDFVMIDEQTNQVLTEDFLNSETGIERYPRLPGNEHSSRIGIFSAKDWASFLKQILQQD
jgi:CheY-like chemotaxis protein